MLTDVFPRMILPCSIKSEVNTVASVVGPAHLLRLVICGMVLRGVCLLLTGPVLKEDEVLEVEIGRESHAVLYFVLFPFYMLAMKYVGLLIAFVIFSAISIWMMEDRGWRHYLPVELLVIVIFVSSRYGLHITLSTMIL